MDSNRNSRIEEILGSLDGRQKATVPDFFYTRLRAKMLARHEGGEKGINQNNTYSRILRPVYVMSALLLILALNAIVFFRSQSETNDVSAENNESVQQSIAFEYSLNDNNTVYDLNPDK